MIGGAIIATNLSGVLLVALSAYGVGFIPSALNVLFALLDQSGESGQLIAAY